MRSKRKLYINKMSTTAEQSVSPPSTETKKKKRCIGCSVPSQTRKVWLIPHILGFLCFMLVTYRTYEVSTVNEGINTAYGTYPSMSFPDICGILPLETSDSKLFFPCAPSSKTLNVN